MNDNGGRILADSGEGHTRERECLAAIERVKSSTEALVKGNAPGAETFPAHLAPPQPYLQKGVKK